MPASPRDFTFISYSHKDKVWLDKLLDTLKPLVRKGSVEPWADTRIQPGDQWRDEIKRALSSAKVAVLLVSRNFLASDFIANHELPPLLKKAKAGGLTVLWVHLSASLYEETDIEDYQAAHNIARPLDSLSESEQGQVLVEIARKIRDAVARKEDGPSPDGSQEAIKGLRPFRHEDAEIFARLGRHVEVDDCARAIADADFRFGILSGESGCGKSSFLQAGLWPKLETYRAPHRCVYVKFSNEDPFETLKRVLSNSLDIPLEDLRRLDLSTVLETAWQADTKPLLLMFDQFEQFFVHRKLKQDREPFVRALADWYRNGKDLSVKILVSIRGDFSDRLAELQSAMGYSIGPGQNIRLEKFAPQDAAKVIKQIAQVEKLPVGERFVESMVKELAGREDGLISPAYLQIMAWVLSRQKEAEKREFTSKAFQKLGGVEGLLDRFLADALDARPGDTSKQTVLKILVALIDLDRNARAGIMTVKALQEKLKDTLNSEEILDAVKWLADPKVRLITPQEQQEGIERDDAYELAHECLIPAVRKSAGKQLSEADRANQILDRRVNEWLGNDQQPSYLLGWRDWRLIERNKPYLIWGEQRNQKEQLLEQTKQRWRRHQRAGVGVMVLLIGAVAAWSSPWGQIQMVKWDLAKLGGGNDRPTLILVAHGLASARYLDEAVDTASRIADPRAKAQALDAVAVGMARVASATKDTELLKRAAEMAGQFTEITDLESKAWALGAVAEAAAQLASATKDPELLARALAVMAQIADSFTKAQVRGAVVEAMAQLASATKDPELLKRATEMAGQFTDLDAKAWALATVAGAAVQVGEASTASELLKRAAEVAGQIADPGKKAQALGAVAEAAARVGEASTASELLRRAEVMVSRIDYAGYPRSKVKALGAVAEVAVQVGEASKATELLKRAAEMAGQIDSPRLKAEALATVAAAMARVANATKDPELLRRAAKMAGQIDQPHAKAGALGAVAEATARMARATKDIELLKRAAEMAGQIDQPYAEAGALGAVAEAAAQVGEASKAIELLKRVVEMAGQIDEPNKKARALRAVAKAAARLGQWREARHYADLNITHEGRAKALIGILQVWRGVDKKASETEGATEE